VRPPRSCCCCCHYLPFHEFPPIFKLVVTKNTAKIIMSGLGGNRTPSLLGSKQSLYSHTSSTVRTGGGHRGPGGPKSKMGKQSRIPWWRKPILKSAIYTDLQRGAWHIGFYTMVRPKKQTLEDLRSMI
jgi:hypothetical protein